MIQPDIFESDNLICLFVLGFEDNSVCTFSDFADFLIFLHFHDKLIIGLTATTIKNYIDMIKLILNCIRGNMITIVKVWRISSMLSFSFP